MIMEVCKSVTLAIDSFERSEFDSAMLHACNAIDGTAKKAFTNINSGNERFTKLLRDNYLTLGVMGMPGINLVDTRFPVVVPKPKAPGGSPDLADVVYGIHRCTHSHGEALPNGFELLPNSSGSSEVTQAIVQSGRIHLSDRIIFGLLGVAVFAPENSQQTIAAQYFLTLGAEHKFIINDWWGRRCDFEAIASQLTLPSVTLDFGGRMTSSYGR
jgi:hypothetical protein